MNITTKSVNTSIDIELEAEEELLLIYRESVLENHTLTVSNFEEMNVQWPSSPSNIDLDVADPVRLGQALMDNITGRQRQYIVEIEWENEADKPFKLIAGETLRGMEEACFHTSYNDFNKWLVAFGYESSYEDYRVVFKKRERFFTDEIAQEYNPGEVSNFFIESDVEYMYSNIKTGYSGKDIESVNGLLEPNGLFEYTTGFISHMKNEADFSSPYRADSIGIETLCWLRGQHQRHPQRQQCICGTPDRTRGQICNKQGH